MPYSNLQDLYSDVDSPERLGIGLVSRHDVTFYESWDIHSIILFRMADRMFAHRAATPDGFPHYVVMQNTQKNFIQVNYTCLSIEATGSKMSPWLLLTAKEEKKIIALFSQEKDRTLFLLHCNADIHLISSVKK